jgi:hypothetical protein
VLEEALAFLATWDKVPKSQLLEVRHCKETPLDCAHHGHEQHMAPTICWSRRTRLHVAPVPAWRMFYKVMMRFGTCLHRGSLACSGGDFPAPQVFERGHFAGVEEMRTNERLFERVAPMGVNDIAMACQYKFEGAAKLDVPVTSFDGLADNTIDAGNRPSRTHLLRWSMLSICCNLAKLRGCCLC